MTARACYLAILLSIGQFRWHVVVNIMFSFSVIISRLDYRLYKDVVFKCISQQGTYLSSHIAYVSPYAGTHTFAESSLGPCSGPGCIKKWPHIPFLLSQPQYETDTREDWTVSQHTQPLWSPITFSHLLRRTHKHAHIMSAVAGSPCGS